MVLPICWMMTGASPSVGSSSSSSRAPVRRMRPIASICCSPPESLVPWLEPAARLRLGNSSKMRSSAKPARPHLRRQQQIFLDVEAGENAALLRAERDAGARDRDRRAADQFAALEAHRAGALLDDAHDRLQRRGLAGAVAAEQRHHLALAARRRSRHAECATRRTRPAESLTASSGALGVKHGRSPDRLRAPSGLFDTVA